MKKLTHTFTAVTLSAALVATAAFAASHAGDAPPAVGARQAQMQMVGYHTGVLGSIEKGEMPYDSAMVDSSAKNLAALAGMEHATLWIAGTEQGAVAGSRAKPDVWSNAAGFKAKFGDMQTAAMAMVGAADAAAVGAAMGALGGSCKACHETYRGPKN